jgi:hypothetical protein
VDLPFATAAAPPALHAGFGELAEALRPHANGYAMDQPGPAGYLCALLSWL